MPSRAILSRRTLGRPPAVDEKGRRRTLQATADLSERVADLERRIDDQDAEIATLKAEAKRRKGGRPKKAKAEPKKTRGKARPSSTEQTEATP